MTVDVANHKQSAAGGPAGTGVSGGGLSARALACVRGDRLVFEDLNFDVAAGGALVLRGVNGVGKSSLLRVLAGLLKPAAGDILWADAAIAADFAAHRARVAYIGHLDAIKLPLTVAENIAFWTSLDGLPDPGAAAIAALARLDIDHLADIPARLLSAGQRRRLNLARLAASRRPLWLLDEPTNSLDEDGIGLLEALMSAHLAQGGVIIAATHQALLSADASTLQMQSASTEAI